MLKDTEYNPNGLSILGLSKFYLTVYYHGSYLTNEAQKYAIEAQQYEPMELG
jgi:hypothetical protein